MLASSVFDSLLTAPVIAFVVALVATLARFDLRLPEAMYPILSTFLLLAIGIKGGKALAAASVGEIWKPLIAAVVSTLAASASYIAAPAAVRFALPQASAGLYVTASLGVTFPFNITLGIPLYVEMALLFT